MPSWVTPGYAADLAGMHVVTVLRQARRGKLLARAAESRKHRGKARTEIAVESLPAVAQERWRSQAGAQRALPAPQDAVDEPAATQAGGDSGGLSSGMLAWAAF